MRKLVSFLFLCFLLLGSVSAQTMSDQQVMDYVKSSMQQGKDQRQIATELARRGVTKEQAERIKKKYEADQKQDMNIPVQENKSRKRTKAGEKVEIGSSQKSVSKDFSFTARGNNNVGNAGIEGNEYAEDGMSGVFDERVWAMDSLSLKNRVYGRNIFNSRNLTFEPSVNLATPPNYRLGPDDEVIIDIWGNNQTTIRETISPDGYISISDIGLVYLNGKTIEAATSYLRKELNKIYTGLDGEEATSQIKVTLGNIRTIQVNVMGEVVHPGTYALSSFSTVFHALYRAGGVSEIGSLRAINVTRGGKTIGTVDVYDFIMNGKTNDDIRLQEGDVVIVPPYESLVSIEGKVKRPMTYEMKKDETMATLLKYAGGFASDAYTRSLRLIRKNGKEYQVNTVDEMNYSVFQMQDGDSVTSEPILTRYENKLEIRGAVYRPGIYQYGGDLNTVRALVKKAEGLMGDAFTGRAVLYRERENLTREVLQVDIAGIMSEAKPDVPLRRNDVLYIPSIHDLEDLGSVTVSGEVTFPGEIAYADNMTLEDAIIQVGGLKESASTVRVDVSRRIKNQDSSSSSSSIAEFFTFSLKDGFVIDGTPGFVLKPYDQVYVRRAPGYSEQVNVTVSGEVLYDGTYTMTDKNERLSDVIKKAGGITQFAYAKGAKLVRRADKEEMTRMEEVLKLMKRELGEGTVDSLNLEVKGTYSVGIDLEKAIAKPGSDADLVLREGDSLIVPELVNTVRIDGAVMMPNTVSYVKGNSLKDYIAQAGGYSNDAKKSRAFVIYMNGQIAKAKGGGKDLIQPGCEIVVPTKSRNRNWNLQSILGVASSLGSLGLTAASLANILK